MKAHHFSAVLAFAALTVVTAGPAVAGCYETIIDQTQTSVSPTELEACLTIWFSGDDCGSSATMVVDNGCGEEIVFEEAGQCFEYDEEVPCPITIPAGQRGSIPLPYHEDEAEFVGRMGDQEVIISASWTRSTEDASTCTVTSLASHTARPWPAVFGGLALLGLFAARRRQRSAEPID